MKIIFSVIAAATIIFFAAISISCTKSNSALADNNPNINDRSIDSVSVAPSSPNTSRAIPIDLDGDGLKDFYMVAAQDSPNVFRTSLIGVPNLVNFVSDNQGYVSTTDPGALIDSVSVPLPPKPHVWTDVVLSSLVGSGFSNGQANGTDFYVGAFTTKSDGKHYGWLRFNISADGRTMTLIELACYSRPNTEIRAGEK